VRRILFSGALSLVALAARAAGPTDADCLSCHDGVSLGESIHAQAGLSCTDCHSDLSSLKEFPHAEKLEPANCVACHDDASAKHASGIHAQALAEGRRGARCTDCHGAGHAVLPSSDAKSPTNHFNVPHTCAKCHDEKDGLVSRFEDSIHGKALGKSGLKVAPNCVTCHSAHDVRDPRDEASPVHRASIARTCGSCHAGILARYETSVHAKAVAGGNTRAAVCTDCHTAHGIRDVAVPAWKLSVIQECGTCHSQSLKTYRDGFHGQASALGFTRVAACADCHGSHEILAVADPGSRVNKANLVQTCGRCHTGASESYVKYDPHARPHDKERSAPVYYTTLFMQVLLAGVFSFFGLHVALWFPKEVRVRRARARAPAATTADEPEAPAQEDKKDGDEPPR
jgi:nitrate/TMAO reductase-like tetraheme cytochrome c subunit